jgi:hypothetical protein
MMQLQSVTIHLEIARVGNGYVVQHHVSHGIGSSPQPTGELYIKNRDELQSWFANMECKIP